MKYFYLTIFTFLTFANAHAEWTWSVESDEGTSYSIDFASIRDKGEYRYAWVKGVLPLGKISNVRSVKQLLKVDCAIYKYRPEHQTVYEDVDASKNPYTIATKSDYQFAIPGSIFYVLLDDICKK